MSRAAAERAFLALLAVAAAALLPEALSYRGGSQHFPAALLAALLALSLAGLLRRSRLEAPGEPFLAHGGRFAAAVALMALATLVMPHLGFFTTATLLIAAMAVGFGFRAPGMLAATIVLYLGFVWLVFQVIFQREVPREFFMPWILGY